MTAEQARELLDARTRTEDPAQDESASARSTGPSTAAAAG
jgi:hypothetical protein